MRQHFIPITILICAVSGLLFSCGSNSFEGKLIFTMVQADHHSPDFISGAQWRYIENGQIAAIKPDKPGKAEILTKDFSSACSPYVSWDGRYLLFSAKQKQEEPWQIWEMDLSKKKFRKITNLENNCIDPVYMPNERVVFSYHSTDATTGQSHALYSCKTDGTDLRQLTFHPHANFASMVMTDGRLLTITRQLYPEIKNPMIMVLRPDGTKADMFFEGDFNNYFSRVREDESNGKLYFVVADSLKEDIISIDYARPGDSRINLTHDDNAVYFDVCPLPTNKLAVVKTEGYGKTAALYEYDIASGKSDRLIYAADGFRILDVTMVRNGVRPKKLPTEVDMGVKTGQIMCQDINFLGNGLAHNSRIAMIADKVEIIGTDSAMGVVPVEKDGSFYIKIIADSPFRIKTLDKNGRMVGEPSGWLWMRPNERRACIGCHEDKNLAPENIVPLAVKKLPVNIPAEVSGLIEKKVELE